jgi:hypothetical protein
MSLIRRCLVAIFLCVALVGLLAGCTSTEQADENPSSSDPVTVQPEFAPSATSVRTVQLYRGDDERSLPVITLNSDEALTLEFDLMELQGRPLSVYFEHADRTWQRDLSPSRTLESFQNDRLVDYQSSRGTEVSYVHYQYRFPNDDIRFRISGNYVLRVTERGRRDSVLLEQPFFVAEETGGLKLQGESIAVPGQRQPSLRPIARFRPPAEIQGDPFGHTACFVRNGRLTDTRCEERPLLVRQPELEFELARDRAYAPSMTEYALDLSTLRSTSQIARVDRSQTPFRVMLDADYARFEGTETASGLTANGQTVVRGALSDRVDPSVRAEYVETRFAFVPSDAQSYSRPFTVAGSFSGMDPARGTTMEWSPAREQYEGTVLLKQGRHQYFYSTSDPAFPEQKQSQQARARSTYTAFVYYRDNRRNTDRLLRVSGFAP